VRLVKSEAILKKNFGERVYDGDIDYTGK